MPACRCLTPPPNRPCASTGDISSFTPSQLSSVLWAMAVLGQVNTAPFRRAWQEVQARGAAAFVAEGEVALTQIWQVSFVRRRTNDDGDDHGDHDL